MFFRRQTIHSRLVASFAGIVSLLLVVALAVALIAFVGVQRVTLRENLQIQAAMVAARSGPALERNDTEALTQFLAVLAQNHNIRWAMVTQGNRRVATFGQIPKELQGQSFLPDDAAALAKSSSLFFVRHPVTNRDQQFGEVFIGAEMSLLHVQTWTAAVGGAGLLAILFLIALPVFHRLVRTVSDPLSQLTRMSQLTSSLERGGEAMSEVISRVGAGALHGGMSASPSANTPSSDEIAPVEIERLGDSFNRMLENIARRDEQMRQSRDELRALNASLLAVRETERTRIAHEIHDELGQRLTAIKLDVARVLPPSTPDGAHLATMLDETVKVVREISWELRPSVLDALGLIAAIEWLGEDFQRRMATRCKVEVPEPSPLIDTEIATQLFRICQELLTNIARHASASRVDIRFTVGKELRLEVCDDGIGMKPNGLEQKSLGLLGIRERVHALGGKLKIETVPQIAGTRVSVSVPMGGSK